MGKTARSALQATIGVIAATFAVTTAAQAGPFLASQRVIDPVDNAFALDTAAGPGGGAAIAFRGPENVSGPGGTSLWVAVHEKGAMPTAALPRGFKLAERVSPTAFGVEQAQVGVDAAGNVTAVWLDAYYDVYVRSHPAGGEWGPIQSLGTFGGGYGADEPLQLELLVAPNGRAVLLTEVGLYDRAPGATEFTLAPDSSEVRHVAMNAAGNVAAVSLGPDLSNHSQAISVRTRTASRPFGAPRPLGLAYYGYAFDPGDHTSVAITDNGTVAAIWQEAAVDESAPDEAKPVGMNVAVRTPGSTFAAGTWAATTRVGTGYDPLALAASSTKIAVRWTDGSDFESTGTRREQVVPGASGPVEVSKPVGYIRGLEAISPTANGRAVTLEGGYSYLPVIRAYTRSRTGEAFTGLQNVIAATGTELYGYNALALDEQGNGYVAWTRRYPGSESTRPQFLVGVTAYDPVAPVLTSVTATPASAGSPVAFAAAATDRMSVPKITWTFGDGTTASGDAVAHTYFKAGIYTARASAKDEAGNTTSWPKTIVVTAAP